jgi:peptidoglycan/xylan/chitin deacetylase (PgdA/CDA1 family)
MMTLSVPVAHAAEMKWVASVVLENALGISVRLQESASDALVLQNGDRTLTVAHDFFYGNGAGSIPPKLPKLPLAWWDVASSLDAHLIRNRVPVLYGTPGFHVDALGNGHLNLDVFGSAFFMLSRYEEMVLPDRDDHDRFPGTASVAHKAGFLDRPIVDEYVEILWAALTRVWPGLERRKRKATNLVSHDVDHPARFAFASLKQTMRTAAGDLLKRGDFVQAVRGPWIRFNSRSQIHRADPFNTFDWIMDVSEQHGLTSAFYFVCGHTHPTMDPQYDIEHPAMRALLRRIRERGHEIGLHGSYNTYQSPTAIATEAARLKQVCAEEDIQQAEWGGRMHYLRWETPTTLRAWDAAGMSYDSTLSYADRAGFRCGTCHEYRAFDPVRRTPLNIRIRPLIAMEWTVMGEHYMGLGTTEAAYQEFDKLRKACHAVDGNFTLLWHNSQFENPKAREMYVSILSAQ